MRPATHPAAKLLPSEVEGERLNYRRRGSMSPTLPPPNTTSLQSTSIPNSTFYFPGPQSNSTTYYADDDLQEPGLSEFETVALACFLTLLPLIFGLISYFGFRSCSRQCWTRWRRSVEPSELSKTLDKEVAERSKSSHALLNDQISQIKTSESEFSVVLVEDSEEGANQTSKLAANGSVITMTMKNNHLIVETEERLVSRQRTVLAKYLPREGMVAKKIQSFFTLISDQGEPSSAITPL